MHTRTEQDAFGEVVVPSERLWGAQTQRSLELFCISHERMPHELIVAIAWTKRAAAIANRDLALLDPQRAQAIVRAADEIIAGQHTAEFPLVVWQTGSGTQTHMNLNEVLAHRGTQLLRELQPDAACLGHHDEVNRGQSSNDVIPTAMHLAAVLGIVHRLQPVLDALRLTFLRQTEEFRDCLKLGRTHLQDATPITLGQEFSGYAAQMTHAAKGISATLAPLHELAIGGTAVGTGLNTHPEFGRRVAVELARTLGLPFREADNRFAALASHDALVQAHGALKTLAVAAIKIANDIRWLSSGPRAGLGEISLPANEPGSSIMAGKVNPTQCEALVMAAYQVMGNDVTIALAGSAGNFELNVCKPLIAHAFCQSVRLLSDALDGFHRHCVRGIRANRAHMRELLARSLMLATALVPHLGYQRTATIVQRAEQDGTSLRTAALASGLIDATDFDRWVRVEDMLAPSSPVPVAGDTPPVE
ncbi:MAG: class II fumarate hydratase [Planctomycetes bacterium]|nr:class II fumarate hydratase [Planctomycetota bacterium]